MIIGPMVVVYLFKYINLSDTTTHFSVNQLTFYILVTGFKHPKGNLFGSSIQSSYSN